MFRIRCTLTMIVIVVSGAARADYFIITATEQSKELAQRTAAQKGGWVLDTNLYSALTPNRYAVVRGPFVKAADAREALTVLHKGYPGAYMKDAGSIRITTLFGRNSPPVIAAALLGELSVTLIEKGGGGNPCEPQEPYVDIQLSFVSVEPMGNGNTEPVRREIDFGSLTLINRTGEIQHMRVCLE